MRLLIGLIALAFFMASSTAMAMQPRRYTDDEKEFFKTFYESCKKSIDENLTEKDFQKTICFAHIKGSSEAATEISMSFGLALMGSVETCKDVEESLEFVSKRLCAPDNLTPYQFARDYVKFVESDEYKPHYEGAIIVNDGAGTVVDEKSMKEATKKYYQSPADLYFQIYACKPKKTGKTPDVR